VAEMMMVTARTVNWKSFDQIANAWTCVHQHGFFMFLPL